MVKWLSYDITFPAVVYGWVVVFSVTLDTMEQWSFVLLRTETNHLIKSDTGIECSSLFQFGPNQQVCYFLIVTDRKLIDSNLMA